MNIKKQFLLLCLAVATGTLWAQVPSGYYSAAEGKIGNDLKIALHNIIKGHTVVSYSGLMNAYPYTDNDGNGNVWDIYSNCKFSYSGNKECGSYKKEGDCWNREHSWPQSWFNEKAGPKSDLFHVYPTDGKVNGMRSNHPYGEVSQPTYTSGNGSKLGPCVTAGYSGTVFEPIDEYKGDLARSYFYMSVRYYSEDGGWGSSGMTSKSEILPWAMTMLLRWSDEDPVSQKEIDRNNVIYSGYQHNRNPFIDHPEYARMIWDPNWQQGTSYAITALEVANGSFNVPAAAVEGTTVTITTRPDAGYEVDGYAVYKTGDTGTTVNVTTNGTFTMPGYPVTVGVTFRQNTTQYLIDLADVSHGTISAEPTRALSGTTVTLTATPSEGYVFHQWYVYKTGDVNTQVIVSDNTFVMPPFNVTVTATFAEEGNPVASGDYLKVTSAPTNWSGEYLIVYEDGLVACDGGLSSLDVASNTIPVTISDNTILSDATTDAAKFIIAPMAGGYSIKSASGKYIGTTGNKNELTTSDSPMLNAVTYNEGDIDIVSAAGAYLRYNSSSGQERFRYYKSGSYTAQKAVQLYKRSGAAAPAATYTITFYDNTGTVVGTQTVNEMEPTALTANAITKEGYEFDGWTTNPDGTGDYYVDGDIVTLFADLNLYAQWDPLYTIAIADVEHGAVSANHTSALEETTVTLTATPDAGYQLYFWQVTYGNGNIVFVEDDEFEMPAADVTVSAVFVAAPAVILAGDDLALPVEPNVSVLDVNSGQTVNVILYDCVLHKDGTWNTLCLPFDLNDISCTPLAGATLMELDTEGTYGDGKQTGFDAATGTLYLCFKPANAIAAGRPYLIKWEEGDVLVSPVFKQVTLSSAEPQPVANNAFEHHVSFVGTYGSTSLVDQAPAVLCLVGDELCAPADNSYLNAFQAYFTVALGEEEAIQTFVLNFGEDPDGVGEVRPEGMKHEKADETWYDLSGRRLTPRAAHAKGIYLVGNRKLMIQ